MAELTVANLDPFTRQSVDAVVLKVFGEKTKVLPRIPMHEGDPLNTRGLEVSVYTSPNPSWGNHNTGGKLAVPDHEENVQSRVYPVRGSRGDELEGSAARMLKAQGERVVTGNLAAILARSAETAAKIMEQNVCATETGELAVVVSRDSATQVTLAKTYSQGSSFSTKKTKKRARLAWYSAAGAQRTTTNTLSVVSNTTAPVANTGVLTVDAVPGDVVATDIVVHGDPTTEGNYKRALTGLQDLISNTGVIQTVDRSVVREFQGLVEDAGGNNITVNRLVKFRNNLRNRVEDDIPDLESLTSPSQVEAYQAQGYNFIERQAPGSNFGQDYKGVTFNGKEPMTSYDVHEDRWYMLRFSVFRKGWIKEFGKVNDDGLDWRLVYSNDTAFDKWVCWWLFEGQVWAKQFNCNGVIKNLNFADYSNFASAN